MFAAPPGSGITELSFLFSCRPLLRQSPKQCAIAWPRFTNRLTVLLRVADALSPPAVRMTPMAVDKRVHRRYALKLPLTAQSLTNGNGGAETSNVSARGVF